MTVDADGEKVTPYYLYLSAEGEVARVAVVDDVLTTGTTVTVLARALKRAGAREVHVWAVARSPGTVAAGSAPPISLARDAYLSVLCVSSVQEGAGETAAIITVFVLPPRES